jgi:hypothetical protein
MSTDAEYRQMAEKAEHMSRFAPSEADREAWLLLAQGWMSLIRTQQAIFNTTVGNGHDTPDAR